MINYSNFCQDVKTDLMNFLNQALFGKIKSLPDKKLILNLTFGVLKSGSLHLSNIVRALKEDSKPINVEKRLSDALKSRDLLKNENLLMQYNLRELSVEPIKIITDDLDIIKPYGRKFEYLTYAHDGSKPERSKEKV